MIKIIKKYKFNLRPCKREPIMTHKEKSLQSLFQSFFVFFIEMAGPHDFPKNFNIDVLYIFVCFKMTAVYNILSSVNI